MKGCGTSPKKRILEDRRALLEEEGDLVRDHKAMHEENFLSGWLREDVEGKLQEEEEMRRRTKVEETKSGRRRLREKLREGRGGTEPRVF